MTTLMTLDHDSMRLLLELSALAVACGLGIWRLVVLRREARDKPLAEYRYDMRRDGQRLEMQ